MTLTLRKALRKVIPLRYDLADVPPDRFFYSKGGPGPAYCLAFLEAKLRVSSDGSGTLSIHFGKRELSTADINDNRRVIRVSPFITMLKTPAHINYRQGLYDGTN
jgi:hypothetical protein